MRTRLFLILSFVLLASTGRAAAIDRIDPPFWWQGFEHQGLQLMVTGDEIADYDPTLAYDGVTISAVHRGDSKNYLFVYLKIDPSAKPGEFDINFTSGERQLTHRYSLLARNNDPNHVNGFTGADVIYLITPDRFVNGDRSNDTVDGYVDALDRSAEFGRHGGDIAGIRKSLDYIADLGFTAIWLNPVLENAMPEASYHGYATTDFYAVDPRFGSNEDYRKLVRDAKAKGLGTIMDMIVNHCGSRHHWLRDKPTSDWFNSAGEFRGTSHARTTHQDPYASNYDKRAFTDGWFVEHMPDINQRNPLARDYLIQNAIWWTEYLGLAGIRQDTYPYPDKDFMTEWTRRIMQEYPDFNIVGEEWSPNPAIVSYWQVGKENHDGYVSFLPSVMDFPLQIALSSVLKAEPPQWGSVWTPVYEMLGNDFLYPDPFNLVIFPDNHDMSRVFTQLDEDIALYNMAIVFYLTMRGIPQFYYGTEVLMSHPGTESHGAIRSDFPGGWDGDAKDAFSGRGLTDDEKNAQSTLRKLLQWRKTADVIHDGDLMQFTPVKNIYAYFRYDDEDTVMVVFNRGDGVEVVDTSRFAERIGTRQTATDVVSGKRYNVSRNLVLEPRSVLLLEFDN